MILNEIGVMQGRLLPKYKGRYQAHPVGYWQDEFALAQELKLNLIEFILDYNDYELNPLLSDSGISAIQTISQQTGVKVKTICADFFMESPLHHMDTHVVDTGVSILQQLIQKAGCLGVEVIVLPCVDQSTLKDQRDEEALIASLRQMIPLLKEKRITLSLETDLPPQRFKSLLDRLNAPCFSINYDTGNSASLGFDPIEELSVYGNHITDIHIKDRKRGGGSVQLGSGDTKFQEFFRTLKKYNYTGPFIMQAYRDDEGLRIFKEQLAWTRQTLEELYWR